MTPNEFIEKWQDSPLSERAGSQPFFLDLCTLLGMEPPNDPDSYCFERGATRTGAGHGWADVWKRGHFGWENKGPGGDLRVALKQLMTYALALDNPPLLVVSNREITEIHTHFTGTPSETHTIRLEDIGTPENQEKLRWLFTDPGRFRPGRTVLDITKDAAGRFADIAKSMSGRGHDPQKVAHFLIQCLFCMFAEDIGLLPRDLFARVIDKRQGNAAKLAGSLAGMFGAMRVGGDFLLEDIAWFNGGLFEKVDVVEMTAREIEALREVSHMDWGSIEPSILGTLFERGLDPKIRAPLGANYTDPGTIMKLVRPVVIEPLEREWEAAKARIVTLMGRYHGGGKGSQNAKNEAEGLFLGHVERLKKFRVLDPACGSGNFLYLSLRALKDLEHRANLEAEALGLQRQLVIETSPANVLGIEINDYAAELARVTVWIGEIQWMLKHGYDIRRNPILATLDHIENRDALLDADGSEAEWPACDVIVGNPPFLGGTLMRGELGDGYVDTLRATYSGRVPGGADLVTYWYEKARAQIAAQRCEAAGLVATNSIRGGANRKVLERIVGTTRIFEAWSDEPWVNEGAAVRVSLVGFGSSLPADHHVRLDGIEVPSIHPDLTTGEGINLTRAVRLAENALVCFEGIKKYGPFDIPGETARTWLGSAGNPNGHSNADVLRPWINATDVVRNASDTWVVDFTGLAAAQAALYEAPFQFALDNVRPARANDRNARTREQWWLYERPRLEMRRAIAPLQRFIVTPVVAKHRIFAWRPTPTLAMNLLDVIARADDTTFGVLHSRFHDLWSLRLGTSLEDRPRYTPTTCFETFPFPAGMTPRDTANGAPAGPLAEAIAGAARRLNELRENWMNPPEWVEHVAEVVSGFPDRIIPKPGHEVELKKRTLTNLYNARPTWLDNAHKALDAAVAAAYGWRDYTPDMADDEILRRLLALNRERSGPA